MLKKLVCLFAYSTLLSLACNAHEANQEEVKAVQVEENAESQSNQLFVISEKADAEQEEVKGVQQDQVKESQIVMNNDVDAEQEEVEEETESKLA